MLQHTTRERNIQEQTTTHTTTAALILDQRDTQIAIREKRERKEN